MIVAHLADLHLGHQAYDRSVRGRNVRERDVAIAFQRAVKEVVRAAPDLVLIVGDVFDRPDPPPGAFLALGRGLETLRAALPEAPVLMVGGARDVGPSPGQPGPLAAMDAFPNVESADSTARAVHLAKLGARVLLLPYRTLREPPPPAVAPDPKARWNIVALPARVGEEGPSIRTSEWDYVALGAGHVAASPSGRARDPGSLERIEPDPWVEIDTPHGFLIADLERGTVEHRPVEGRPTVALARVRVAGNGASSGEAKVLEVAREVPGGLEGRIVRLPLSGADPKMLQSLESGVVGTLRQTALHVDVRPELLAEVPVADSGAVATEPVEELGGIGWPDGFRLLPPAPPGNPASGLTAMVWEGRAGLKRALSSEPGDGGDAGDGAPSEAGGPSGPMRACWARRRFIDLDHLSMECTRALAELGGLGRVAADIEATGFPEPIEHPGLLAAHLDELDSELTRARDRLADLATIGEELAQAEEEEQRLRGEAAVASGDAEAAVMEWLRERQDAETTLHAYRDRAREMKRRIEELEAEAGDAPCPTCGRPLAEHYQTALDSLREEFDGIVQDGRWWRRRWDQLAVKAPEVQKREGDAVRLHAELEEAGERVHRARLGLREQDELRAREVLLVRQRGFLAGTEPEEGDLSLAQAIALRDDWLRGMAAARGLLARRAGSYLVRISSGRFPGFMVESDGVVRPIGLGQGEGAGRGLDAAALALELAFAELASEVTNGRVTASGMLIIGDLDLLPADYRVRATALLAERSRALGPISVLVTPAAFGGAREHFDHGVELLTAGGSRSLAAGPAMVRLEDG